MNQIERSTRKTKKGIVVSNKMQKTLVVEVESIMQHPRYPKTIKRSRKYYVHTEQPHQIGDSVIIVETRPLSKLKRWRVVE